jgi:tetratricopeptide (TPR) repeat protein
MRTTPLIPAVVTIVAVIGCSRAPVEAKAAPSSDRALCFMSAQADRVGLKADALVLRGREWVQKARNSGDPGFYLHADACAKLALEAQPEHTAALVLRGLALLNDHKFVEAKALAEQMLARDRDDVGAWATLSDALLELGDVDGAARAAQEMMDRKPSLPSYARASYLLWLKGDVDGALQSSAWAYDAGRNQKDHEPVAWVLTDAANIFWHKGDVDGALKGYEMALVEKDDFAPALVGKARALLAQGGERREAEAVLLLERALAHAPSVDAAWTLSHAHAALGNTAKANEAIEQSIRIGRAGDKRMLAVLLATLNRDLDEARRALDDDTSARGGVYADDAEALLSMREGDLDAARTWSQRAMALGTPDPRIALHRGVILWKSGDASGKLLVERALEQGAKNDAAMVALAREVLQ